MKKLKPTKLKPTKISKYEVSPHFVTKAAKLADDLSNTLRTSEKFVWTSRIYLSLGILIIFFLFLTFVGLFFDIEIFNTFNEKVLGTYQEVNIFCEVGNFSYKLRDAEELVQFQESFSNSSCYLRGEKT